MAETKQYRVKAGKTFHGFNGYVATEGEILTAQHPSFIKKGLQFDEIELVEETETEPAESAETDEPTGETKPKARRRAKTEEQI